MNKTSLIQSSPEQLTLLSSADIEDSYFRETEARGEHTGVRLWTQDPDKYRVIVSLLAEGVGQLRVAALVKSSVHTVRAIKGRECAAIEKERARLASDGRSAAGLCIEAILERLADNAARDKIPARDLGVLAGILIDKAELLAGRATSRVDINRDPDLGDFRDMIQRARDGFTADNSGSKEQPAIDIEFEMVDDSDAEAATDPAGDPNT